MIIDVIAKNVNIEKIEAGGLEGFRRVIEIKTITGEIIRIVLYADKKEELEG